MKLKQAEILASRGVSPDSADVILESCRNFKHPVPILKTGLTCIDGEVVDYRELDPPEETIMGMAGFATYDDIINSISLGRSQKIFFTKNSLGTTAAQKSMDLWQASGQPAAGTFGTSGTARTITNSSTGAMAYTNASGGRTMALLSMGGFSTISIGTILLYDRLAEYPFTGTTTSASFTTVALPARDVNGATSGEGIMMMLESYSATATAAVTVTPTYTNQGGTGSHTNAFTSQATSALAGGIANPVGQMWVPLQAGDTGVRTIESYTLGASLLAANMSFTLIRPLAFLPIMVQNVWIERDMVMQIANMPKLFDGTAFGLSMFCNNTTTPCQGYLTVAEN